MTDKNFSPLIAILQLLETTPRGGTRNEMCAELPFENEKQSSNACFNLKAAGHIEANQGKYFITPADRAHLAKKSDAPAAPKATATPRLVQLMGPMMISRATSRSLQPRRPLHRAQPNAADCQRGYQPPAESPNLPHQLPHQHHRRPTTPASPSPTPRS